ncbi:hypothetical protein SprV_0301052200 [Sparganum proliferum]
MDVNDDDLVPGGGDLEAHSMVTPICRTRADGGGSGGSGGGGGGARGGGGSGGCYGGDDDGGVGDGDSAGIF